MSTTNSHIKHFNPQRYEQALLISKDLQLKIKEEGFCVIDLLSQEEVGKLKEGFKQFSTLINGGFGESFWPSGRSKDSKIRNIAKDNINQVVPGKLKQILQENAYEFIGGTYLVKPPSPDSALNPHQDSAHVNEFTAFSIYAWIPLEDVDETNGAMKVLPKSHQIDIKQRSLNVPWVLEPHLKVLEKHMETIKMKAGQVMLFDAALIHSSPPNFSQDTRVAINYYIHPKGHPFTHYYTDEQTLNGKVEAYSVTPGFYYSEDFESKPGIQYERLEDQDLLIGTISSEELEQLLQELTGKSISAKIFKFFNKFRGL